MRAAPRCVLCNKTRRKASDCRNGYRRAQTGTRCWECGKVGHKAEHCKSSYINKVACFLGQKLAGNPERRQNQKKTESPLS